MLGLGAFLVTANLAALGFAIDKERTYAERESSIRAAKSSLDADVAAYGSLEIKSADLQKDIARKRSELDDLAAKVSSLSADAARLDKLRELLRDAQEQARKAATDRADAEAARKAASDDFSGLKNKADAGRQELADLQSKKASAQFAIDGLNRSLSEAEGKKQQADAQLSDVQKRLNDFEPKLDELEKTKVTLAAARTDQQIAEKRRDAAQDDAKDAERRRGEARDEIAKFVSQQQTLSASITDLIANKSDLEGKAASLQQQNGDLRKEQDELNTNIAPFRAKIERMKADADALAGVKAQLDATKTELSQKQADLAKLSSALAASQDKAAAITTLETRRSGLAKDVDAVQAKVDQLTGTKGELERGVADLHKAIGEIEAKLRQLKDQQEQQSQLCAAQGQKASLDAEIDELSLRRDKAREELATLRGQLEAERCPKPEQTSAKPKKSQTP